MEVIDWKNWRNVTGRKPVFVHMHIAKSGGTTLYTLITKVSKNVKLCPQSQRYGVPFKKLVQGTRNFTKCNYLDYEGGLWMENYMPKHIDTHFITIMRNPLELRISGLEHNRRINDVDPREILRQLEQGTTDMGKLNSYHMENFMAKSLVCGAPASGDRVSKFRECNYTIGEAIAKAEGMFWIGVTEHYRSSLCVLAYQLGAFDKDSCDCARRRGAGGKGGGGSGVKSYNKNPDWQLTKSAYTVANLKLLSDMNKDDVVLHALAITRLLRDAETIRNATGVEVFC